MNNYSKPAPNMAARRNLPDSGPTLGAPEAAVASSVAREIAMVRVASEIALANRRDEEECRLELIAACRIPAFADRALYDFPRGGGRVCGGSVDLAREAARIWRNNEFGVTVLEDAPERVLIEGWARDLERNRRIALQDDFPKRKQIKGENGTRWVTISDDRDLRELIGKRGSILVRNAIFRLIPRWVELEAVEVAQATQELVVQEELQRVKNRAEVIEPILQAFAQYGVTEEHLTRFLGQPASEWTAEHIATLRSVFRDAKQDPGSIESRFGVRSAAQRAGAPQTLGDLVDRP